MDDLWETVYTADDWYDGPRGGVTDYQGLPYYYRSVYLDMPTWNPDEDRFELILLLPVEFEAMLELHAIWERWNQAYKAGTTSNGLDDERVLPEDRVRWDELNRMLAISVSAKSASAILVHGEFELGCRRVRWRMVEASSLA